MTAGIQVRSTQGTVQVDDENYNLALRYSGVVAPAWGGNAYVATWTTTLGSLSGPVVAIRSGAPTWVMETVDLGNKWWRITIGSTSTASFEYYVFDEITEVPAHGEGLLIFRRYDRSKVAYYSGYRPFRPVNAFYDIYSGQSFGTSANKAAVVMSAPGIDYQLILNQYPDGNSQFTEVMWAMMMRFSGNTLVIDPVVFGQNTYPMNLPAPVPAFTTPAAAVIVEVAGIL